MTARMIGHVCKTCGTVYVEIAPGGRCPICYFYHNDGYLMEVEDRNVLTPWVVERAIYEPLPTVRPRPTPPPAKTPSARRRSILAILRGKMR